MNRRLLIAGTSIAIVAATILAACGGGSSGGMSSSPGMAGASGVINGFGSVIVNGHEFSADAGTRVLDGDNDDAASSINSLQVGMTVDVDADGGTATMLRFTSAVRGEVDAVDLNGTMTLTVLGQTVEVTSGTSFAGYMSNNSMGSPIKQLGDVHVGDYVVVYGYIECTGSSCSSGATNVIATLVYEPASVGIYRVQGYVSAPGSNGFMINGLQVVIATSGPSPTVCYPTSCVFAAGSFVSVRSSTAPTVVNGTLTLTAGEVKLRPYAPTFAVGATVTIEGPVTQLNGSTFVVRGIPVDASGVSSMPALANNQIVEVTGTISAGGTLNATSIDVERAATFVLMGPIDMGSISTSGFSVLGEVFTVNSMTRFADWSMDDRPFNSTNFPTVLMSGDQVVVSGYAANGGNVATRVERIRTPTSPTAAVVGMVSTDNPSADTLTVAGITVTVGSMTTLHYPGAGMSPSLSGFFSAITPNTTVVAAVGAPGSPAGTSAITAANAAVLSPTSTCWGGGGGGGD